ncbi:MAG: hypothetical protein QM613_04135 [Micrococcaceae bacterium]
MPARIKPEGLKLKRINKVKELHKQQKQLELEMNKALLEAVEAGVPKTQLAEVVGITQQSMSVKITKLQNN